VTVGYYAQHHADALHRDATVQQEVVAADLDALPARVRGVLGAFLFSGDDVDKKISVLSGGERARVALARLLIKPGNLLLMDEPTNHLDLESSEELAESLAGYDGTMVFVSHNRSLIRRLATRIWAVSDRAVETYSGTLDEYMYSQRVRLEGGGAQVASGASAGAGPDGAGKRSRDEDKARRRREAAERQKRAVLLGPITRRIETLEARIGELETAQAERGAALSDPEVYGDEGRRRTLLREYQEAVDKLDELTARWEAAHEELATAEAEMARDVEPDAGDAGASVG
jgi:ATP-binding cassette subfamily F protein 3